MVPVIPELNYTPIDEILSTVSRVRNTFYTHKTRPLKFRLTQIRKLYWAYVLVIFCSILTAFADQFQGSKTMKQSCSKPTSWISVKASSKLV